MDMVHMKIIARMKSDFPDKFGIPRQSGLVDNLVSTIVFEPEYRNPDALRGLEDFSHLWIIWQFSKTVREDWSPTVRPPRLGGNTRMGVFATRSPFRPNEIGLSSVKIIGLERTTQFGTVIHVSGADLMDGTPIYDIKPYIKYADARPHAVCGYVDGLQERSLKVNIPKEIAVAIPDKTVLEALVQTLSLDPRPSYHDDPDREYGLSFAGLNVKFKVFLRILTVTAIE